MIKLGNLTLTDEDLGAIAHIVHNETPEEWATRALNYPKGGERAVKAKIDKYKAAYLSAKDEPGYQTAVELSVKRKADDNTRRSQVREAANARKVVEEAALNARIAAEVTRQLAARA